MLIVWSMIGTIVFWFAGGGILADKCIDRAYRRSQLKEAITSALEDDVKGLPRKPLQNYFPESLDEKNLSSKDFRIVDKKLQKMSHRVESSRELEHVFNKVEDYRASRRSAYQEVGE